jgi:hypothetical protein
MLLTFAPHLRPAALRSSAATSAVSVFSFGVWAAGAALNRASSSTARSWTSVGAMFLHTLLSIDLRQGAIAASAPHRPRSRGR